MKGPTAIILQFLLFAGFRYELALCLNGTAPLPNMEESEATAFREFRQAGQPKSHHNYLLVDPQKLMGKKLTLKLEDFRLFVEGVFYVGKGKNARSAQHLKEAKEKYNKVRTHSPSSHSILPPSSLQSPKAQRIRDVWAAGHGVLSLHLFHNTAAAEAFCKEASMIDAIGQ